MELNAHQTTQPVIGVYPIPPARPTVITENPRNTSELGILIRQLAQGGLTNKEIRSSLKIAKIYNKLGKFLTVEQIDHYLDPKWSPDMRPFVLPGVGKVGRRKYAKTHPRWFAGKQEHVAAPAILPVAIPKTNPAAYSAVASALTILESPVFSDETARMLVKTIFKEVLSKKE